MRSDIFVNKSSLFMFDLHGCDVYILIYVGPEIDLKLHR